MAGSIPLAVFDAARGPGPYGIATTPDGQLFAISARSIVRPALPRFLEPPVPRQGARRGWSDSRCAVDHQLELALERPPRATRFLSFAMHSAGVLDERYNEHLAGVGYRI
jgi:streptogramin lyase